jgi:Flp pilus assembly pilin Flp
MVYLFAFFIGVMLITAVSFFVKQLAWRWAFASR